MSNSLKSFSELGDLYHSDVFLVESKKQDDADLGFKKAGAQKGDGPTAAKGFVKKLDEKKAPKAEVKKLPAKKVTKESTEISTMNKKPSFDELYERAMNEGPDDVVQPVTDDAVDAPAVDAPLGDESPVGGEEAAETVDPKELFAQICDLVDQLKAHYGVVDDDLSVGDEDGFPGGVGGDATDIEDIAPTQESVETTELPDSKGASLQGKNNKVAAVKVVKKKADTGTVKTDPDPKPLADKVSAMQSKNNKVAASGAQAKSGASIFET